MPQTLAAPEPDATGDAASGPVSDNESGREIRDLHDWTKRSATWSAVHRHRTAKDCQHRRASQRLVHMGTRLHTPRRPVDRLLRLLQVLDCDVQLVVRAKSA